MERWIVLPEPDVKTDREGRSHPSAHHSQLNHLSGANVFACANFGEKFLARSAIEIQNS